MAKFFYTARDKSGKKIQDAEEANTSDEILSRLQARDWLVLNITPELKDGIGKLRPEIAGKVRFRTTHYGVKSDDLAIFCRQLSTLLGAGVTILKSLDIIGKQLTSRKLLDIVKVLQKDMEAGLSLHEAMAKHKSVFSELWVNLVESGEASGNLAVVLNRLAGYLERAANFRNKIISALIYPAILMFTGTGALLFLTLKIVPVFAEIFQGFNITLPLLTRMLIDLSKFLRGMFVYIVIIIFVGTYLIKKFIQTREGRFASEKLMFSMPVMGDFFRAIVIERFSSEMFTLVEGGVPILYSLEITEKSVGNLTVGHIIHQVKDDVRAGKTLSQPLERSGFFDPMVVQMVAIGEEIGELSQMFKKINTYYQEVVETFLLRFTALFEPLMLVFIGIVIGLMVIGMFLPIFQIAQISGS